MKIMIPMMKSMMIRMIRRILLLTPHLVPVLAALLTKTLLKKAVNPATNPVNLVLPPQATTKPKIPKMLKMAKLFTSWPKRTPNIMVIQPKFMVGTIEMSKKQPQEENPVQALKSKKKNPGPFSNLKSLKS